ncbi:uncharacterized protein F4807DRAFT_10114 [Annulohypoxylon truncatum]|uniref:uncharacterized protein n=1 Tax=Annulohypoxylon truncatum TaxID=327061 RepID=UPI0020087F93|nr:uncharacterized protein F4807DRAFT_10114 [Annulohypoxylon truncatum]KAI1214848.1 hypothetical protein F4807DRAFT_10114 [Annulohypoxylon truncatum]
MIQEHHHDQGAGQERRVGSKHRLSSSGSSNNGSVISRVLGSFRQKIREERNKKKKKSSSLDFGEGHDDWAAVAAANYQGTHHPDRPSQDKRVKTILSDDEYAAEIERMQERSQSHYNTGVHYDTGGHYGADEQRAASRTSSQLTDLPNFSYSSKSPKHRKSSASPASPAFPMFEGHEWPQPPREPPRENASMKDHFQYQHQPQAPPQPPQSQLQSVMSPVSPSARTIQVYNECSNDVLDRGPIVRHIATTRPHLLLPRKAPSPPKPKKSPSPVPQTQAQPQYSPLPSPSPLPPPRIATPHASSGPPTPPPSSAEADNRRSSNGSLSLYKRRHCSSDLTLGDANPEHTHRHSIYHNPNATTTELLRSTTQHSPPTSPKTPAPPPRGAEERDAYFPDTHLDELPRLCPWPGCTAVLRTEQEKADNLCGDCHETLCPRESAFFGRKGTSPHSSSMNHGVATAIATAVPPVPARGDDADALRALGGTKVSLAENVKVNRAPRGSVKLVNSKFSSVSGFKLQPPPLGKRAQQQQQQQQTQQGQGLAQQRSPTTPNSPTSPTTPASSDQSPMQNRRPSQQHSPRPSLPRRSHDEGQAAAGSNAGKRMSSREFAYKHESAMVQPLSPANSSTSGPSKGNNNNNNNSNGEQQQHHQHQQHIGFQDVRWEPPSPKVARRKTTVIKFKPIFKSAFRPDPYANRASRHVSRYSRYSHASTATRADSPSLSEGSWMTDSAASLSPVTSSESESESENEYGIDRGHQQSKLQAQSQPQPPPPPPPRQQQQQRNAPAPAHKEAHVQFATPVTQRPAPKERRLSQLVAVKQEKAPPSRDTILYREIEDIIDCYTMGGDGSDEENERRKADNIASFFSKEPEAVWMRKKGFI